VVKPESVATQQLIGRQIIVISDTLLPESRDEKKHEDSKNGVLYVVSSVSVAAGVAVALTVVAAVKLLVSNRRNKVRVTVTESEMASLRNPLLKHQQPTPAPEMYGYTEEDTCPSDLQLPIQNHFLQVPFSCMIFVTSSQF
jgi:hypothetical protein